MATTTIPTTFAGPPTPDTPTVAQHNAYGKVAAGLMGLSDDNLGKAMIPRMVGTFAPLVLGSAVLRPIQLWAPRTYRVPSNESLLLSQVNPYTTLQITPAVGGSLFTVVSGGAYTVGGLECLLPVGPGDIITLPTAETSGYPPILSGFATDADVHIAPVVRNITSTTTYTVPASSVFLLTFLGVDSADSIGGLVDLLANNAAVMPAPGIRLGGSTRCLYPFSLFAAGVVLKSSGATAITIAGYVLS